MDIALNRNLDGFNERVKKYYRYILYIMRVTDYNLPEDLEDPVPQLEKLLRGKGDVDRCVSLGESYYKYFKSNWRYLNFDQRLSLQTAKLAVACKFSNNEELSKLIDSIETTYYNNRGPVDKLFHEFE